MQTLLTVNILNSNSNLTQIDCIKNFGNLNCKIIIANIDKDIKYKHQANNLEIVKFYSDKGISEIKNKLVQMCKTPWMIFLEAWEELVDAQSFIESLATKSKKAYKLNIIQGDLLTKETRLWHRNSKIQFINPVFDTAIGDAELSMEMILSSGGEHQIDFIHHIDKWQEKLPLSAEPLYYRASYALKKKNWDSFINYGIAYLHQEQNKNMSWYMTHYYLSMVYCYLKKDYSKSISHVLNCIMKKPVMAEFWCLLGDNYYAINQFEKAISFYDNAIILGSRRKKTCDWSMEISKYLEYPQKMIDASKKVLEATSGYAGNNQ